MTRHWLRYGLYTISFFYLASCASGGSDEWPEEIKSKFLLPLTYPDSEWRDDDFGVPVTAADRELLENHAPLLYVAEGSYEPVDFYDQLLPLTALHDHSGDKVMESPSRAELKEVERRPGYYLDYLGDHPRCGQRCQGRPAIYGRVYRETWQPPPGITGSARDMLILRYNVVFTASGLPTEKSWYKIWGSHLAGDPDVWHELDIHGAIYLIFSADDQKLRAGLLAQHNHFRTYLPEDFPTQSIRGRADAVQICFSRRSNEPYPCQQAERREQTVGNPENFSTILTGEMPWFDGGFDEVPGLESNARLVMTQVKTLPSRDPLFVAWINLGDQLPLFGFIPSFFRAGPPGMDLDTTPALQSHLDKAEFWYFAPGDTVAIEKYDVAMADFFNPEVDELRDHNGKRLWEAVFR